MEKICENCGYFVPSAIPLEGYDWGYCKNAESPFVAINGKKEPSVFIWADKTCTAFKLKEESE